ncbi:prenyltransferase [Coprinopsis cinerea okayama7|uniref:4-hydroxybenzoate polyprenyltransferase, mitochondrial n=1 Tax=Coprinopsis cinerea (strain Okayama-7 / 130 / ATCC MYA-4618 / FGSC 9003) TaxID=240176 RepID=A8P7P5_COPC7|nr:prenyltransferase [Coprinopsis cinerea okayama7\|eukprot:XP_001839404.2 prenyltransferase [Coprinopsis cinerea okayama7\
MSELDKTTLFANGDAHIYGTIPLATTTKPESTIVLLGHDIAPYVQLTRIQKYGGVLLLWWPFAWSLTIAATTLNLSFFEFSSGLLYSFVFANLLRSAGCIWNDILDRDFDRQVERTKNRPLASGRATVKGALVFLLMHLVFLVAMLHPLNQFARIVGFFAIFFFPGLYPLMKRITYWPQAWLGLTMNIGVPLTWAAISGECPTPALVFYAGTWAWCIWYDTIYACQDKKDDVNAGIKSTAVLFDSYTKVILAFFGMITFGCFSVAGYLNGSHWTYYVVTVLGGMAHFGWQWSKVDLDSPKSCWKMFTSNAFSFGYVIWTGLLIEYIMTAYMRL